MNATELPDLPGLSDYCASAVGESDGKSTQYYLSVQLRIATPAGHIGGIVKLRSSDCFKFHRNLCCDIMQQVFKFWTKEEYKRFTVWVQEVAQKESACFHFSAMTSSKSMRSIEDRSFSALLAQRADIGF